MSWLGHSSCKCNVWSRPPKTVTHPVPHLTHSHISHLNFLTSNEKYSVCDRKGIASDPKLRYNICPQTQQCIIVSNMLCFEASCSNVCPLTRCESLLHNKYRKGVLVCLCEMLRVYVRIHIVFKPCFKQSRMKWVWVFSKIFVSFFFKRNEYFQVLSHILLSLFFHSELPSQLPLQPHFLLLLSVSSWVNKFHAMILQ